MVSTPIDTLKADPKKGKLATLLNNKSKGVREFFNFKKDYPNPKKAIILSAMLPGAGQIYNKKYWKLPIVYGGVGTMVYFISFTNSQYKRFRKAYIYRLDEDDGTPPDEFTTADGVEILPTVSIKERRDYYQKNRELSYIGFAFTYILVGVDAFVDAHLMRFDVSDDLTLHLQPQYDFLPNREGAMGFHLSLQPKAKEPTVFPVQF